MKSEVEWPGVGPEELVRLAVIAASSVGCDVLPAGQPPVEFGSTQKFSAVADWAIAKDISAAQVTVPTNLTMRPSGVCVPCVPIIPIDVVSERPCSRPR